jgi:hypothetical protein
MQTKPFPEFAETDLKAVRQFLTSLRDEQRTTRTPANFRLDSPIPVRNGITRARSRASTTAKGNV